jgi:hypothetical protein
MARDLAGRVGSGSPATVMLVFVFCIVRPTQKPQVNALIVNLDDQGVDRLTVI